MRFRDSHHEHYSDGHWPHGATNYHASISAHLLRKFVVFLRKVIVLFREFAVPWLKLLHGTANPPDQGSLFRKLLSEAADLAVCYRPGVELLSRSANSRSCFTLGLNIFVASTLPGLGRKSTVFRALATFFLSVRMGIWPFQSRYLRNSLKRRSR